MYSADHNERLAILERDFERLFSAFRELNQHVERMTASIEQNTAIIVAMSRRLEADHPDEPWKESLRPDDDE